ncbi:hypothetical protein SAMN05216480_1215 [Pustulibacterium marinum]|uniref:Uncharacterized protein n=1 Tax=Pustulibacterium marinum TaxID=1224947 RepID=A0A1I7ISI3_9FLAO|nr:hypothetical protein [Pustulibacterium marinum]SFU75863.1 hypothetical protein SAMN05216480_1215 [Pustulibacterium marinum]
MKKKYLAVKSLTIAVFGVLGMFSLLMFPFLVGENDAETSLIGYGYVGLLFTSITVIYLMVRKDVTYNHHQLFIK